MGIQVLGPLTVDGSGRLGPHDRVVLQALATRLGQPVSADELIDAVWGDHPPASAAKNLQSSVVKLRKVLGPDAIETSPHGYVLVVPPDHVDAHDFEAQVIRAAASWRRARAIGWPTCWSRRWDNGVAPRSPTSSTGRPVAERQGASMSCAWRLRRCTWTRCCAAVGHGRCWRWLTSWCEPRRFESAAGSSSSSRSTRPAPRVRPCAPCASCGPSSPGSSGSTRPRRCWRWSSRSCSRTPASSSPSRAGGALPLAGTQGVRRRRHRKVLRS